jgi:hypothetical protein
VRFVNEEILKEKMNSNTEQVKITSGNEMNDLGA